MDAYNLYLSTFRYIMNANPEDKSTWCDIFKYLPCLRQMLSCPVCGSVLLVPHGPVHAVCPHHVCQRCLGGRIRSKPSCSWCRDHSQFKENKKLRILILCFKRLCAYVSHSNLGAEISRASVNGYGNEAERTIKVLEEAEHLHDDYIFTPPPTEFPHVSKSASRGLKSLAGQHRVSTVLTSEYNEVNLTQPCKRKRGRPKRVQKITMKPSNMSLTQRARKLKKMALSSAKKSPFVKTRPLKKRLERKPKPLPDTSGLLITQRPHRERSGKYSVGQLWRETFLEEVQPEPYPDSGIEVGSSPDHDHYAPPPALVKPISEKPEHVVNKQELVRKETRLHKHPESESKGMVINDMVNCTDEIQKPRLTLTISKKRYQNFSRRGRPATSNRFKDARLLGKPKFGLSPISASPQSKRGSLPSSSTLSAKQHSDICKCARFKQPNQLTCFGQKCPCYSDRRPCVDCLCNGCKNPLKSTDLAPPLMHIKEADGVDRNLDRSMPRLSPIPRI